MSGEPEKTIGATVLLAYHHRGLNVGLVTSVEPLSFGSENNPAPAPLFFNLHH